jgi:hypothetical protein
MVQASRLCGPDERQPRQWMGYRSYNRRPGHEADRWKGQSHHLICPRRLHCNAVLMLHRLLFFLHSSALCATPTSLSSASTRCQTMLSMPIRMEMSSNHHQEKIQTGMLSWYRLSKRQAAFVGLFHSLLSFILFRALLSLSLSFIRQLRFFFSPKLSRNIKAIKPFSRDS